MTNNTVRRIFITIVSVFVIGILVIGLSACSKGRPGPGGGSISAYSVCIKQTNKIRYNDYYCDQRRAGYSEWYLRPGQTAPRIGQRITDGTSKRPKGRIQNRLPNNGIKLRSKASENRLEGTTKTSTPAKTKSTTKTKSRSSNSGSKSKSGSSRSGSSRR